MRHLRLALGATGLCAATAVLTLAATQQAPAAPVRQHPHVTVCHSDTQTGCLWVDGHAEWR